MTSAYKIVTEYLVTHGFDGLCSHECGCIVGDLAPCGDAIPTGCEAGYRHKHSVTGDWIIATDKAPKTDAEIQAIFDEADL